MRKDLIITITKGSFEVNCLYEDLGELGIAYKLVSSILENYNKNLLREEVPDELLLLRMFELNDIYNTTTFTKPLLMTSSYNLLIKKYAKYNIDKDENRARSCGEIAITKYDRNQHESNTAGRIHIHLDTKTIRVPDERMLHQWSIKEYCKYNGYDISSFDKNNLPKTNIFIQVIKFNELEDVMEFISLAKNGFMIDGLSYIYMVDPNT